MRYFVVALLIALLPLRGWIGDAMATEMATMKAGCHEQVTTAADAPQAQHAVSDKAHPHAAVCAFCTICHTVAVVNFEFPVLPQTPVFAPPPSPNAAFRSVALAPGVKPPIS